MIYCCQPYILNPVVFSVAQRSPERTIFPQIRNRFVSATVKTFFPHLFSSTLLLYYPFQFSNRSTMQVKAKPFLSTVYSPNSDPRYTIVNCGEIHHVKNTKIDW